MIFPMSSTFLCQRGRQFILSLAKLSLVWRLQCESNQ
jgi:hypothetical protein